MTARLVAAVSVIGGQVDAKATAEVIHGQKDADVLTAWTEQNRNESEAA